MLVVGQTYKMMELNPLILHMKKNGDRSLAVKFYSSISGFRVRSQIIRLALPMPISPDITELIYH